MLQEALACGLPVICGQETAAADPEAGELIEGVAIEGADPDTATAALAERIERVLVENRDAARGRCWRAPRLRPLPVQLGRSRRAYLSILTNHVAPTSAFAAGQVSTTP